MKHPDVIANLDSVNQAERVTPVAKAISKTTEPRPCIGFAISDLPPSAVIVSAVRQVMRAPSGNLSNFMQRGFQPCHWTHLPWLRHGLFVTIYGDYVVIFANGLQLPLLKNLPLGEAVVPDLALVAASSTAHRAPSSADI
jgi:hypothetical protein